MCLKSGNACILRGGSEASNTNQEIEKCMIDGLLSAGLPEKSIQLIKNQDRKLVTQLIKSESKIDLIIPRGGKSLIKVIANDSMVPVLKHYEGLCHVFVDENADMKKAIDISLNAKIYRFFQDLPLFYFLQYFILAKTRQQKNLILFDFLFSYFLFLVGRLCKKL